MNMFKLLALLLSFALLLTLPGLASRPFSTKGEPREALVAQAMINSGDWILPTRYGDEFATKPPFSHWIMALASLPNGEVTEFTARFPSFIISLATVLFLFMFLKRETSQHLALLTCVVLLTSIEWHRASVTARVDMTLAGLCVIALLALYSWGESQNIKSLVIASLCIPGAILTKGPVGLVLPLGIAMLHYILSGKGIKFTVLTALKVTIPAILIASSWYVAAYLQGGDAFLNTFIEENFSRFQGTMDPGEDPHTHSFLYLLGTVLLGTIPWSIFILVGGILLLLKQRPILKRFRLKDLYSNFRNLPSFDRFSIITILCYIIFFAIPSSKRSVYLLPIYPFLSFWIARWSISLTVFSSTLTKRANYITAAIALSLIFISLVPLFYKYYFSNFYTDLFNSISTTWGVFEWSACLFTLLLIIFLIFKLASANIHQQIFSFAALIGATIFFLNSNILPLFSDALSAKIWALQLSKNLDPKLPSYSYKMRNYGLNFYLNGSLQVAEDISDINSDAYIYIETSKSAEFLKDLIDYTPQLISTSQNPIERSTSILSLYKVTKPKA